MVSFLSLPGQVTALSDLNPRPIEGLVWSEGISKVWLTSTIL